MKKLIVAALAAVFLLCSSASVMSAELSSYGLMRITGQWFDNPAFTPEDTSDGDDFAVNQRARAYFDFTANENLKATIGLEWDSAWGDYDTNPQSRVGFRNSGLALGGDANMIETKHLYMDFAFPGTQVDVRAGQWWVELPSNFGSSILGGDMPAISINAPINDQMGLTVGWARPYDLAPHGKASGDEQDILFASMPISADGFSVTPFGAYGFMGDGSTFDNQGQTIGYAGATSLGFAGTSMAPFGDDVDAWWLGLSGDVSMMDPFVLKYDVNYGTMEGDDAETKGYFADLIAEYKMDMMTPQVYGFYGSGDDYSDVSKSTPEGGRMPVYFTESFVPTGLAFAGCCVGGTVKDGQFSYHGAGIWSAGFALRDISFTDKLKSMVQIAYYEGTNDKEMAGIYGTPYNNQLTKKDSAVEIGGDVQYFLYDNLRAVAEAGYIAMDADEDVWGQGYEDITRVALSLDYTW